MSNPVTTAVSSISRTTAMRWVGGWICAALGAPALAIALEQVLAPDEPEQLLIQAGGALFAAVALLVLCGAVSLIAFAISDRDKRGEVLRACALVATPVSVALSISASLGANAFLTMLLGRWGPASLIVFAMSMLTLGLFLGRGFWRTLLDSVVIVLRLAVVGRTASNGLNGPAAAGPVPPTNP